jgi:NAD(P)H-hydrate epimerase
LSLAGQYDYLHDDNCVEIEVLTSKFKALVLGPGLGQHPQTLKAVRRLLTECSLPLVIDADAINALAGALDLLTKRGDNIPILTPHPGEFSRLTGLTIAEIEADRFRLARQFAMDHQVVLLLKGAGTLIADPAGRIRINSSGNCGLATGGSGDVLSGLIGGLLVQGLSPFDAASLGAWLHGASADFLANEIGSAGMVASDLLRTIPVVRHHLEGVCSC